MSSHAVHFFAAFIIILTHSAIVSVKGQCTTERCENVDPSLSIVAEIQQENAEEFDQLKKQVQSINNLLTASFHQQTSQHDAVLRSLQALDSRSWEHDVNIKQMQSIHQQVNESLLEMKTLQALDSRSEEHDVYIRQIQSIHEQFNESLQEMKSLKAADRLPQEHICFKQARSIHELLNESYQEMKNQHDTVMTSLEAADRRHVKEQDSCIKQDLSIREVLNDSFYELNNQHDTVMTSLEAVIRNLQEHDIAIKNQTHKLSKLVIDICDPASELCDCSDIKAMGQNTSGVYKVCVGRQPNRICTYAYCDMSGSADNRASLVFQRRKDGSVDFNRAWVDYKQGFGNLNGEFWLGNEMLFLLTSKRNYKLRVNLEDFSGNKSFAEYMRFSISSSASNYTLTISGYSGNAGDSMYYNNGQQFSTNDVNNRNNCARRLRAGWWYDNCSYAHLNGIYHHSSETTELDMWIKWYHWYTRWTYSLKATEMKLVPVA